MVKYTPLERSSPSSLICQPVVFFSSSKLIWAVVPLLHNAHFHPVSMYTLKEGRVHAHVTLGTRGFSRVRREFSARKVSGTQGTHTCVLL